MDTTFFQTVADNWGVVTIVCMVMFVQIACVIYTLIKSFRVSAIFPETAHREYSYYDYKVSAHGTIRKELSDILSTTNNYLRVGSTCNIDLPFIQKICTDKIENLMSEAGALINMPLYFGLCATFVSIILGVSDLDIKNLFVEGSQAIAAYQQTKPVSDLLMSVGLAMTASFMGLLLMIFGSLCHRWACNICEAGADNYYTFLGEEVAPHIARKLSLAETADKISQSFQTLSNSATALDRFHAYQDSLNTTATKVETGLSKLDGFITQLNSVVNNQEASNHLIKRFETAINENFPSGSTAVKQWRKAYDDLSADAKRVSDSLQTELKNISEYIASFTNANKEVFESIAGQKEILSTLIEGLQKQVDKEDALTQQITDLASAIKDLSARENRKDAQIMATLDIMTKTIIELKKDKDNEEEE